jgi:hypothetical protein
MGVQAKKKWSQGSERVKKPVNLLLTTWGGTGIGRDDEVTFINLPFIQIGALVGSGSLWPGSAIGMDALHRIPEYTGNKTLKVSRS